MKKFLRILYLAIILILSLWVFIHPFKAETNILKAIDNTDELAALSEKYSSKINVIIKAETPDEVYAVEDNLSGLKSTSSDGVFDFYKSHSNMLLSQDDRKLLKNNDFEKIKQNSLENLYNPLFIPLLPLNDDPYMFFTNFMSDLYQDDGIIQYENNFYKVLTFDISNENDVEKFIDFQSKFPDNVFLTGAPVHSYLTSSRAKIEVNTISFLSILFIITMCVYYFRTLKVLLPVFLSLCAGYLSGFLVTALIWRDIHILTFVFSSTLIGICVDYSLHYFITRENILKNLTASLITTVCAFFILLFSGTVLLKQIGVFTICGLVSVYTFVLLFYPQNYSFNCRKLFQVDRKFLKYVFVVMCLALIGLFFVKYNDDITTLYVPSEKLLRAEKVYSEVTGTKNKTSFLIIDKKDLQKNLETEEQIADLLKNCKYQALSKYVPSLKRQEENRKLIQKLYKKSSNDKPLQAEGFPYKDNFIIEGGKTLMILNNFDGFETFKNFEGVKCINMSESISAIVKNLRQRCMKLFLPVFLIILLALKFIFGFKNAFKILLPSLLSIFFTASLLSILKIDLNLFHVLAFFLVIGFSLDYSIFRFSDEKCNDAVLMSCMTSVFSFTLLSLTSFKLISSLGFVLAVGLLSSYIFSTVLIVKKSVI